MTDQKPDRQDEAGLRAKLVEFDSFLNEPPAYEDKTMVREYRHSAYAKWSSLCADIVKLIDGPTRDGAEGAGDLPLDAEHPINYRKAFAKPAPDAMREALEREEQYLIGHFDAECDIMPGDVRGSFHRLRELLRAANSMKEAAAKIAQPWADGETFASTGPVDVAIIRVRTKIAARIRALSRQVPRDLYYHEVAYVRRLEGALRSIAEADERKPRAPDDSDWRSRFLEAKRVAKCAIEK